MVEIKINIGSVPEGVKFSDYPEGTLFVLSESKPKWDPETNKAIPFEPIPLVYPEEVRRMIEEAEKQ